jgi:hypothetical protein
VFYMNFKDLMASSAQANWITIKKEYGSCDPIVEMEDQECTCLFYGQPTLKRLHKSTL